MFSECQRAFDGLEQRVLVLEGKAINGEAPPWHNPIAEALGREDTITPDEVVSYIKWAKGMLVAWNKVGKMVAEEGWSEAPAEVKVRVQRLLDQLAGQQKALALQAAQLKAACDAVTGIPAMREINRLQAKINSQHDEIDRLQGTANKMEQELTLAKQDLREANAKLAAIKAELEK
jgi:hypothetical protein